MAYPALLLMTVRGSVSHLLIMIRKDFNGRRVSDFPASALILLSSRVILNNRT